MFTSNNKYIAVLSACCTLFTCTANISLLMIGLLTRASGQSPNILWITIEDTSPPFIGCYGNDDAGTPIMDQLAKDGIRFTNAFSTGTVCSPSRSTIITGVPTYKMGTGHHRSKYPVPGFIKGFPFYLKAKGYHTSNNAKTDYNLADERDFIQVAWNESADTAGWWNRQPGQPFFSVFNFAESHQSRTMSMSFDWYKKNVWDHLPTEDRIADDAFQMPPFYHDTPEMRKQFARVYNSIKLTDNRIGKLLSRLEADGLKEETIIFIYADHGEGIPRAKTNGINLGYRVPFMIVFPEKYKHLSPWGPAGTVSDELINFEDLAPTMISLTGGDIPDYLKGRILIGDQRSQPKNYLLLSVDRADNGPDLVRTITDGRFLYARNFMPFQPEMRYIRYMEIADITQHMRADLRLNRLNETQSKLFAPRSPEVLYDIENDIWELNNLVNDPLYAAILDTMRHQLLANILRSKDIHFIPEYELGLISKSTTPYEYRMDTIQYPLASIYHAAALSGFKDMATLNQQLQLLTDDNKIARYWAAVGLLSHEKASLMPHQSNLIKAIDDDYPPVSITAAAILYHHFGVDQAVSALKKYCMDDNMDVALMALNYLLYTENKTPFIETVQKVHKTPDRNYNVKAACMDFLGILGLIENNTQTEN